MVFALLRHVWNAREVATVTTTPYWEEADKDLVRADFAMSTRRLELSNEQLRNRTASQLAELGRKSDILNRLKAQRDVLKVEVLGLKAQVAALKKRLDRDREEPKVHDVGAMLRQWIPHRVHH